MLFSGIGDEAGSSVDLQIKATKQLGWNYIELRAIDGENINYISEAKFDEVVEKLKQSSIRVNCIASSIANWNKDPRKDEDFEKSFDELKRAIPRMQRLGTNMIRGMSFALLEDSYNDEDLEKLIFKKLKILVEICQDAGIFYLHENCMNHFSQSYEHMKRLIDRINSPAFKILFDTGNPPITDNRMGQNPFRKQDSWEVYCYLKECIYHVHIKDCKFIRERDDVFPEAKYTLPGEGDGNVRRIVKDLLRRGYNGYFSIEPHLVDVFHVKNKDYNNSQIKEKKFNSYIEYGKRFMNMVKEVKEEINMLTTN